MSAGFQLPFLLVLTSILPISAWGNLQSCYEALIDKQDIFHGDIVKTQIIGNDVYEIRDADLIERYKDEFEKFRAFASNPAHWKKVVTPNDSDPGYRLLLDDYQVNGFQFYAKAKLNESGAVNVFSMSMQTAVDFQVGDSRKNGHNIFAVVKLGANDLGKIEVQSMDYSNKCSDFVGCHSIRANLYKDNQFEKDTRNKLSNALDRVKNSENDLIDKLTADLFAVNAACIDPRYLSGGQPSQRLIRLKVQSIMGNVVAEYQSYLRKQSKSGHVIEDSLDSFKIFFMKLTDENQKLKCGKLFLDPLYHILKDDCLTKYKDPRNNLRGNSVGTNKDKTPEIVPDNFIDDAITDVRIPSQTAVRQLRQDCGDVSDLSYDWNGLVATAVPDGSGAVSASSAEKYVPIKK